jgi:mRNA interferase RelE/StbE
MSQEAGYRILLHSNIEKQLSRIPKAQALRIVEAVRSLKEIPRPVHSKHLTGELYRIREGNYRIVYAVFDVERVVFIGKIGRRSEKFYRDLASLLAAARKALGDQK